MPLISPRGAALALSLTAASFLVGGAPTRAAAPPPPLVFGEPVTVDAQRLVGEPDLVMPRDGRRYVSAPWGVTTDTAFLWRSEDRGESYRQVQAAPGVQQPYAFRTGGDTEYQPAPPAAPGQPNRIYFVNQNNLDTNTCGYTDDAGRTFTFNSGLVCPQQVGADRQWIAVTRVDPSVAANGGRLDHDVEYLWYTHVGGTTELHRSDNGQAYSTTSATYVPSNTTTGDAPGNALADPRTGVVYVCVSVSGADSAHNGVLVGWSADGGKTLHVLDAVPRTTAQGTASTDFAVIAMDSAGGLWLAYSTQGASGSPWQTWLTHSTGSTAESSGVRSVPVAGAVPQQWSRPVPLTGPGSAHPEITHSVFPWVTAGDPGRVDVAFYGTSMPLSYSPNSQPAPWSTYVVQTLDGLDATPVVTMARASSGHSHLASICFSGVGCTGTGNRNMLDFFEIGHDAAGAAVLVYDDDANSLAAAFPGGPVVTVATQVGGATLFGGPPLTGVPLRAASVTDRAGDGFLPTDDTSHPALDLLGAGVALRDPATLSVTLRVADLSGPVASLPVTERAVGVTYLVTWKRADDLWYAAAHVDAAGTWRFDAGRPQSVPFTGTGGPKFAVYGLNPNATSVTGTVAGGTITIAVPAAAVGGPAAGDTLRQVTGFSLADRFAGGEPVLSDQADATAPFADTLGTVPSTPTPTAGATPTPTASAGGGATPGGPPPGLVNTSGTGGSGGAALLAAALAGAAGAAHRRRRGAGRRGAQAAGLRRLGRPGASGAAAGPGVGSAGHG